MAGETGAPRPALATWAGGVTGREHDITMAINDAANAAWPIFTSLRCGMGAIIGR
jgi:hypothetical protein